MLLFYKYDQWVYTGTINRLTTYTKLSSCILYIPTGKHTQPCQQYNIYYNISQTLKPIKP